MLGLASLVVTAPAVSPARVPAEEILSGIGETIASQEGVMPRSELIGTLAEAFPPYGDDTTCLAPSVSRESFECGSGTSCRFASLGGIGGPRIILGVEDAYFVVPGSAFENRLQYELGRGTYKEDIPGVARPYLADILEAARLSTNVEYDISSRLDEGSPPHAYAYALFGTLEKRDSNFSLVRESLLAGSYDWRVVEQDVTLEIGNEVFKKNIGLFYESEVPKGLSKSKVKRNIGWRGCNPLRRTALLGIQTSP